MIQYKRQNATMRHFCASIDLIAQYAKNAFFKYIYYMKLYMPFFTQIGTILAININVRPI
jgi:hypothetical protein